MKFSTTFKNYTRHDKYSRQTSENDIALIRLRKQIVFTFDKRPACLHSDLSDLNSNVSLFATGWGSTSAERKIFSI